MNTVSDAVIIRSKVHNDQIPSCRIGLNWFWKYFILRTHKLKEVAEAILKLL